MNHLSVFFSNLHPLLPFGKMDRYQRVEKPREETPINDNEIRITAQGRMRSYISYATSLLQEKGANEIVFKAMGRAINKTVMIVELIKRRIVGLHQNTAIGSTDITDTWEPLEEGLLPLETTRHVSLITITLSKEVLDTSSVGYQLPLPSDLVKPLADFDDEGVKPQKVHLMGTSEAVVVEAGEGAEVSYGNIASDYVDGGWNNMDRGYSRGGWGRGRGRGFRGRGRGGYGGRGNYQQEDGDNYEAPAPIQFRVVLLPLLYILLELPAIAIGLLSTAVVVEEAKTVEGAEILEQMDQQEVVAEHNLSCYMGKACCLMSFLQWVYCLLFHLGVLFNHIGYYLTVVCINHLAIVFSVAFSSRALLGCSP
ncbi:hypothetical protein Taro_002991 [Colocasia esculenta]|uniref:DNA/RNA-binding protein Alba-like domain-containing protein n=1 Tax=Colocasia esculenta TaxID=4460 RepID=A0A843TQH0_COLES|nr:hypothetical protein [Colocasia esculenta]